MKIRVSLVDRQAHVLHEFDIETDEPPKVILWNERAFTLPAMWKRRGSKWESYGNEVVCRQTI